jgi:hypothetical protein
MSFDMNRCKKGDKLVSVHGTILEYVGKTGPREYPHRVKYPDNQGEGTRADDGHVFRFNRLPEDEDIAGFAPKETGRKRR